MNRFFYRFIPSRRLTDEQFVELIRRDIRIRKRMRIISLVLALGFGFLSIKAFRLLMMASQMGHPPNPAWIGIFIAGIILGAFWFSMFVTAIFLATNAISGLRIHRLEELLVAYYDLQKKTDCPVGISTGDNPGQADRDVRHNNKFDERKRKA